MLSKELLNRDRWVEKVHPFTGDR